MRTWLVPIAVLTVVVLLIALGVLGIGMAMYTEEYCVTRRSFDPYGHEGQTVRGPKFTSPITLSCHFEGVGWRSITDLRPITFAILVLAGQSAHDRSLVLDSAEEPGLKSPPLSSMTIAHSSSALLRGPALLVKATGAAIAPPVPTRPSPYPPWYRRPYRA